jgi:hypothetical protein
MIVRSGIGACYSSIQHNLHAVNKSRALLYLGKAVVNAITPAITVTLFIHLMLVKSYYCSRGPQCLGFITSMRRVQLIAALPTNILSYLSNVLVSLDMKLLVYRLNHCQILMKFIYCKLCKQIFLQELGLEKERTNTRETAVWGRIGIRNSDCQLSCLSRFRAC